MLPGDPPYCAGLPVVYTSIGDFLYAGYYGDIMSQRCSPTSENDSLVYRTRCDLGGEATLSTSVLRALDSGTDYDVQGSDTVVFEHIDPDALDDLFSPISDGDRNGRVRFTVDRYEVTATSAGEITIRDRTVADDD